MRAFCAAFVFVFSAGAAHFSLPITVRELPLRAEFVTIHTAVDFTALLRAHNVTTPIDERSIRLFDKRGAEIPYQFSATNHPRPRARALQPGTSPNVSYAAEYSSTNAPGNLRVAGELTWIIKTTRSGEEKFTLKFSTPESGTIVQTPFPPENFRMFDAQGLGTRVRWFPAMQIGPKWPVDGILHFYESTNFITSYNIGPELNDPNPRTRRPHFYPVHGPDSIGLTEFGKPHDPTGSHAHHYSLWIAHHDVNGVSFWGEGAGIIAHEELPLIEDGPIYSRVVQKNRWRHNDADLLHETRAITTYRSAANFRALDIELALSPATNNPVTFGKTSFGFLAARVTESMTVFDGGGEIRTSEGKVNESGAHLTRARWLDQSGPIAQDKWGGIAILDCAENPNFPTGWHCRNDGWAGAAFNMNAPHKLDLGQSLRLRYRIILHRGDAKSARLDRRFEEWSARPQVQIGAAKKL